MELYPATGAFVLGFAAIVTGCFPLTARKGPTYSDCRSYSIQNDQDNYLVSCTKGLILYRTQVKTAISQAMVAAISPLRDEAL
jgi:hypothetical protein